MKVKELLELLEGVDPELEVVIPDGDHFYGFIRSAGKAKAGVNSEGEWIESWEDAEAEGWEVKDVFEVSQEG